MASQKIQGLNIKLSADTTAVEQALSKANKTIRDTNKELNQVNKLLKFDPKNTTYLAQKQTLLSDAINGTKNKLEQLRKIQEEADKDPSIDKNTKGYRDLQRQIEQAETELKKFNKEAKETDTALDGAGKSASIFSDVLGASLTSKAISFGLDTLKKGLQSIANLMKSVASGLFNLVKQGVEYNAEMETYTTSIKAMLNGDEKATNNLIKSLKKLGQQSGYSNSTLLEGARNLLSADINAENATKTIEAMARALYGVGASNDDLSRMITNMQGIASTGKATAQDLKQFKDIGVNVSKLVAEATGKTVEQVEKAGITFEMLSDAFIKASEDGGRYATTFEDLSGTFQAQVNSIQSNWQQLLGDFALDTTSALSQDILPSINNLLSSMTGAFEEGGMEGLQEAFSTGISDVIAVLSDSGTIEQVLSGASNIIDTIASAFDPNTEQGAKNKEALDDAMSKVIGILDQFIKDHIDELVAIGRTIGSGIVSGIKQAIRDYFGYDVNPTEYDMQMAAQMWGSGGFGAIQSKGFGALKTSGYGNQITLNANFTANGNLSEAQAMRFADLMVEQINERLGEQV